MVGDTSAAPRVFLQPAGGPDAQRHYATTVMRPVSLHTCADFLTAHDIAELARWHGGTSTRAWGVTPGDNMRNRTKWRRMRPGDAVLFCGQGQVFARAFVIHTAHCAPLARRLWGEDEEHDTWEFMYFLTAPSSVSVPYSRLAATLGFAPNYVVLGFSSLSEQQSRRVWLDLGLHVD